MDDQRRLERGDLAADGDDGGAQRPADRGMRRED
jgi:hypothetical protein